MRPIEELRAAFISANLTAGGCIEAKEIFEEMVHFAVVGMNQGKRGLYFRFPCKPGQWTKVDDTTRWNTDRACVTCPQCLEKLHTEPWLCESEDKR